MPLWNYVAKKYKVKIKNKQKSFLMKACGRIVSRFGIDYNFFMNRFATTYRNTIYIPFTPGKKNTYWSARSQVAVCMHEIKHILQYRNDKRFFWKWVRSKSYRAKVEAEAYCFDMQYYFLTNRKFNCDRYIENTLASLETMYKCSQKDMDSCRKTMVAAKNYISKGRILSDSRDVLDWIRKNS